MGLGKGSECLSMAQSLTCVGLQASNGNSEPRAVEVFRVSPGVHCAQIHATQRTQGKAANLYFHTHSVCEVSLEADLNSCLTAPWPVNHSKPLLVLLRTCFMSILSHVGFQLISRHMISSYYIHFSPSFH